MTFEHYSCPTVEGSFVDLDGERYYKISHVDQMNPFFISVVSASDHWLFISSTGSLSAGRIRPENALFPYKSVDHIHESAENTGSKTIIKVASEQGVSMWEPFNRHHDGLYQVERHLYKNTIGDKIVFEELNHTLKLKFQYSWNTSEEFGFVRRSQITDLSGTTREIELIDGLQNLLPSGAPLSALQTRSALVDAYKWNELLDGSSLALFTMYAKLSDRAEPGSNSNRIPGYRARIHWPSFYNVVTGKTLALPNLIALQHIPLSPAGVIAKRPAPIALPNSCAA